MNAKKNSFANISYDVLGTFLRPITNHIEKELQSSAIILYHRVSDELDQYYPATPIEMFEKQLDYIQENYRVVHLEEIIKRVIQQKKINGLCAITFDDGFWDFKNTAYPILVKRQLPATHFLVTESVLKGVPNWNYRLNRALHFCALDSNGRFVERHQGNPNNFELRTAQLIFEQYCSNVRNVKLAEVEEKYRISSSTKMLRPLDILNFDEQIVHWGSHTCSHQTLSLCNNEKLTKELVNSKRELEEILHRDVKFISYPNGFYNQGVLDAAKKAGYQAGFAVNFDRFQSTPELLYQIPRFDLGVRSLKSLSLELSGGINFIHSLFGKSRSYKL